MSTQLETNKPFPNNCSKVMMCAQINAPGSIDIVERPIPSLSQYDILIKMEGCGLCGSNLPLWEGRDWFTYPLEAGAPGHEGWGRVAAIGEKVTKFKVGDRVSALSYYAFSQFDKVNENDAVYLSPELDHVAFPGEPLGCAINVFKRSGIKRGDKVLIIGAGFLGLIVCQLAVTEGADVTVMSRREYALNMAYQCGASHCVIIDEFHKTVETVNKELGGSCDCVVEATGYQYPLDLAGELVKIRGKLIIAGYHQDGIRQINMQQWNWKGIDVINAHERDNKQYVNGMKDAVDALLQKKINPQFLYTHIIPIEQIKDAFELQKNRPDGFLKALVTL